MAQDYTTFIKGTKPINNARREKGRGLRMSDYDPLKEKQPTDYTGLKIVAILAPVFFARYFP